MVLVVEDSVVVRDRLGALIRDAKVPCRTVYAGNGAMARAQFDCHRPVVTVLDIALPDESGLELLRDFKAQRPDAVIIMLTNYAFPEFRERATDLGCDHFLNKSTEFEKICDVLRDHVKKPLAPAAEKGGEE